MKILLSGFMPFGEYNENPSQKLVESLCADSDYPFHLDGIILPVTFKGAFPLLKEKIDQIKPDYVICFGLAESRHDISLEEIAVNINDARIPDNDGYQPKNKLIITDGKNELRSTLPNKEWLRHARKNDYPVSLSQTAGTYVCNNTMYQVIDIGDRLGFKAGFIHISNELSINKTKSTLLELLKLL